MRIGKQTIHFIFLLFTISGCTESFFVGGDGGSADSGVDVARPSSDVLIIPDSVGYTSAGDRERMLLRGTIVTPDVIIANGEVLVKRDRIVCVGSSCSSRAEATGATVVNTEGLIFPGLIDAHNHIQYNYLPVWKPSKLFKNSGQWAASKEYGDFLSFHRDHEQVSKLLCQMVKYSEVRSLLSGTTTVQGTPKYGTCVKTLVRNAELSPIYHGLFDQDYIQTAALGVSSLDMAKAQELLDNFSDGTTRSFFIHLSEGIDDTSRQEFYKLSSLGLLDPHVVIIHGTALGQTELKLVKQAGMKLVWSPSSNMALYGATNDIKAARSLGIPLALAPDWTLTGAQNLIDEMRFVWKYNQEQLQGLFSAKEIVEMVTINPAQFLGAEKAIGRIEEGFLADLMVIRGDAKHPYESLVTAKTEQVSLVLVNGTPLYGDESLMVQLAPNAFCEPMTVCGANKTVCVKEGDYASDTLNETLHDIKTKLSVNSDPGVLSLDPCSRP